MNNKLLINLLLLVLVAILGLFAWLSPDAEQQQVDRVTQVKPKAITTMLIKHPDGAVVSFERRGEHWFMRQPYALAANPVKMASLVRVVEAPALQSFPRPEQDRLGQFGLDRPIQLKLNGDEFLFGGIEPISGHRYLLFNGRLMLIVDRFQHLLSSTPERLLSHQLLPEGADLEEIKAPDYHLKRTQQGWALQSGQTDVGGDDLSKRVRQWRNAQALQIKPFEMAPEGAIVNVRLAGDTEIRYVIVTEQKRIWLIQPELKLGFLLPANSSLLQPITSSPPKPPAEKAGDA